MVLLVPNMPMWLVLTAAMLASATDTPPAADGIKPVTFKSAKTLYDLNQCLTAKLSEVGEVVSVRTDYDKTTIVLRDVPGGPMTIDLAPPDVTVTSRFLPETRSLVAACI